MKPKHRTEPQRWAYAMRRASQAVDRMVVAKALPEKLRASSWAELWGTIAGIRATRHSPPGVADRPRLRSVR